MNVLCLFQIFSFKTSTIYLDLVEELRDRGHNVFCLAGTSDTAMPSGVVDEHGVKTVYVLLDDQFSSDKIRKGIIQVTMGRTFLRHVKKYLWNEKIDLIIYPTPPVTFGNLVMKLKTHYKAKSYLMLKDIFPQNAVDLKMMNENSLPHRYFCSLEQKLYAASDKIGCMSNANIEYLKTHYPQLDTSRLELFPNTVKVKDIKIEPPKEKDQLKFTFGGNLGKPQAIDFLLLCIERLRGYMKAHFTIIGSGTEQAMVEDYIKEKKPANLTYIPFLPRDEYEKILAETDVGLVVLSPDFSIPNYPSRILSYMQMAKPILAVTDRVTDIHALVTYEARCGWWCSSDDPVAFIEAVEKICENQEVLGELGANGREYLKKNFNTERSVDILEKFLEGENNG